MTTNWAEERAAALQVRVQQLSSECVMYRKNIAELKRQRNELQRRIYASLECCPDHPEFTPADWREAVWNQETTQSYREWVAHRIAATEGDES